MKVLAKVILFRNLLCIVKLPQIMFGAFPKIFLKIQDCTTKGSMEAVCLVALCLSM